MADQTELFRIPCRGGFVPCGDGVYRIPLSAYLGDLAELRRVATRVAKTARRLLRRANQGAKSTTYVETRVVDGALMADLVAYATGILTPELPLCGPPDSAAAQVAEVIRAASSAAEAQVQGMQHGVPVTIALADTPAAPDDQTYRVASGEAKLLADALSTALRKEPVTVRVMGGNVEFPPWTPYVSQDICEPHDRVLIIDGVLDSSCSARVIGTDHQTEETIEVAITPACRDLLLQAQKDRRVVHCQLHRIAGESMSQGRAQRRYVLVNPWLGESIPYQMSL